MDAQQSIAISYRQSEASFGDLCTLLKSQASSTSASISLKSVENERGRFRVWAGNIGAHQAGGRASLDYRLREASDVKSEVIKILDYLRRTVIRLSSIVVNGETTFEKDFSSDSDSEPDDDEVSSRQQLSSGNSSHVLLRDIRETINSLYKLSIAIRNPAPHDRYLSIDVSHFECVDVQHALDKFPKLASNQKLAERLGISNSKRRQRFKYRQQHAEKLSKDIEQLPVQELSLLRLQENSIPKEEAAPSLTSTKPSEMASTAASEYFKVSSEIEEIESNTYSQTSYAMSIETTDGGFLLRVPPPPEECSNELHFICPYCFLECDIKRHHWQKHVFRDLQPYICTFGDCPKQDTLFESRNEWFNHELQAHRQKWLCHECSYTSTDRDEFESHQKELHLAGFTEAQISALIETCQRPMDEIALADCPLCDSDNAQPVSGVSQDISSELHTLSAVNFRRHLGRHLEQFSLFVLPRTYDEDDQDFDSNKAESDAQSDSAGQWTSSESGSSVTELSTAKAKMTNTPLQFPSHVLTHLDASGERLVVFCYACRNEWYYEDGGMECPQCKGNATQIVTINDDPRFRNRDDISGSIYNSQIGIGKGKEPENSKTVMDNKIPDFRGHFLNLIHDSGVLSNISTDYGPIVSCHSCQKEWYQDAWGLVCPQCNGEFVEIMDHSGKNNKLVDGERLASSDVKDEQIEEGTASETVARDNEKISSEETIESRVARIRARVAELIGNNDSPQESESHSLSRAEPSGLSWQDVTIPHIRAQLDYYFSTDNLLKDIWLRKHMDSQGFVHLTLIASFSRVQKLTLDLEMVRLAADSSQNIELVHGSDGVDRLRVKAGWENWILPMSARDDSAKNDGPEYFIRPRPQSYDAPQEGSSEASKEANSRRASSTSTKPAVTFILLQEEPPYYLQCPFFDIGCSVQFFPQDYGRWVSHTLEHWKGNPPPIYCVCVFCDTEFRGRNIWRKRMHHIAQHFADGSKMEDSKVDLAMYLYMCDKGLLSKVDYRSLSSDFKVLIESGHRTIFPSADSSATPSKQKHTPQNGPNFQKTQDANRTFSALLLPELFDTTIHQPTPPNLSTDPILRSSYDTTINYQTQAPQFGMSLSRLCSPQVWNLEPISEESRLSGAIQRFKMLESATSPSPIDLDSETYNFEMVVEQSSTMDAQESLQTAKPLERDEKQLTTAILKLRATLADQDKRSKAMSQGPPKDDLDREIESNRHAYMILIRALEDCKARDLLVKERSLKKVDEAKIEELADKIFEPLEELEEAEASKRAGAAQSIAFPSMTTSQLPMREPYIFIDEHNRHKRLKVIRACEGCRRRKIKCDAATTNTWPCSACIRLKVHCIPPPVNSGNSAEESSVAEAVNIMQAATRSKPVYNSPIIASTGVLASELHPSNLPPGNSDVQSPDTASAITPVAVKESMGD